MIKKLLSKLLNRETISYLIFGILTTIVCLASYEAIKLIFTGGKEPSVLIMNIANVGSWVIAVAFAFVTNKFFVFNSKSVALSVLFKEVTSFVGARLLSLGFEIVWMNVTVGLIGINDSIAKIGAQFGIVVMNYVFSKLFIFRNKEKQ